MGKRTNASNTLHVCCNRSCNYFAFMAFDGGLALMLGGSGVAVIDCHFLDHIRWSFQVFLFYVLCVLGGGGVFATV